MTRVWCSLVSSSSLAASWSLGQAAWRRGVEFLRMSPLVRTVLIVTLIAGGVAVLLFILRPGT